MIIYRRVSIKERLPEYSETRSQPYIVVCTDVLNSKYDEQLREAYLWRDGDDCTPYLTVGDRASNALAGFDEITHWLEEVEI